MVEAFQHFLRVLLHDGIELFKKLQSFGRDACVDDTAVFGVASAPHESELLEAAQKTGDVGVAADETLADIRTSKAGLSRTSQNTKHVILGRRDAMGLQRLLKVVLKPVSSADNVEQGLVFKAGEGTRLPDFFL